MIWWYDDMIWITTGQYLTACCGCNGEWLGGVLWVAGFLSNIWHDRYVVPSLPTWSWPATPHFFFAQYPLLPLLGCCHPYARIPLTSHTKSHRYVTFPWKTTTAVLVCWLSEKIASCFHVHIAVYILPFGSLWMAGTHVLDINAYMIIHNLSNIHIFIIHNCLLLILLPVPGIAVQLCFMCKLLLRYCVGMIPILAKYIHTHTYSAYIYIPIHTVHVYMYMWCNWCM